MAGARVFNGLSRAEVRSLLLMEVKSELIDRLTAYENSPMNVGFVWRVEVAAYPAEDGAFAIQLAGRVKGAADLIPDQIVAFLHNQLTEDTRFAGHLTFPKVSWKWHLDLENITDRPVAAVPRAVALTSEDGKRIDLTPLSVIPTAQDQNRPRDAALADPHAAGVRRATERLLKTGVNDGVSPAPDYRERDIQEIRRQQQAFAAEEKLPSPIESRLDRLERMIETVLNQKADPTGIRDTGVIHARAVPIGEQPIGKIENVPNHTGTGLKIVGGAKPSPGAEAAATYGAGSPIGPVQTEEVVERIALDLEHPGVELGGVGAPDAVRRAAGLPIPQRTEVKGVGLVDLPLGSF